MQEMTDAQLIEIFRKGDILAIETLLARYKYRVRAWFRRFGVDDQDSEDLYGEWSLRVLRSIGGFRGDASFSTWAFSIAYHLGTDHYRRMQARPQVSGKPVDENVVDEPQKNIFQRIVDNDALRQCINELTPGQREAIHAHFILDLTLEEAAKFLNIPTTTLNPRIHQALIKLRKCVTSRS